MVHGKIRTLVDIFGLSLSLSLFLSLFLSSISSIFLSLSLPASSTKLPPAPAPAVGLNILGCGGERTLTSSQSRVKKNQ